MDSSQHTVTIPLKDYNELTNNLTGGSAMLDVHGPVVERVQAFLEIVLDGMNKAPTIDHRGILIKFAANKNFLSNMLKGE